MQQKAISALKNNINKQRQKQYIYALLSAQYIPRIQNTNLITPY